MVAGLTCYGCCYDRRTVLVAGVVLDDEHGSHAALLGAHHGAEVGVKYISTFDYTQFNSHSGYSPVKAEPQRGTDLHEGI